MHLPRQTNMDITLPLLPPSHKLPLPPNYHYSPHTHTFVVSSTDGTAKSATECRVNIICTNINIVVLRYTQPIEGLIDKNAFEQNVKCAQNARNRRCTKWTGQSGGSVGLIGRTMRTNRGWTRNGRWWRTNIERATNIPRTPHPARRVIHSSSQLFIRLAAYLITENQTEVFMKICATAIDLQKWDPFQAFWGRFS